MQNMTLDLRQIEHQRLSNATNVSIHAILLNWYTVPDAVAIIDPLLEGFSADVFSIASDAYLIPA